MKTKEVAEYYDDYVAAQLSSGINDRIYHLYKMLLTLGLKSNSNVVELGSGIGTLTFLLSKFVKKGHIEAVDLSPKSTEFASRKIKNARIRFVTGDVVVHRPAIKDVNFITLFDIIEHIPIERHNDLFNHLAKLANENTKILINIPNPAAIEYDIKNHPEMLQLIDQPLPLTFILENIERNGLMLTYFKTYSIWLENDYQFFAIEKKKEFKEVTLSSKRNIFQKGKKRLERLYISLRYKYC